MKRLFSPQTYFDGKIVGFILVILSRFKALFYVNDSLYQPTLLSAKFAKQMASFGVFRLFSDYGLSCMLPFTNMRIISSKYIFLFFIGKSIKKEQ